MSRVQSLCVTALFAVLLALGAWVTVPTLPPFTMQTFVLYCALWLLRGKRGVAAVMLYLFLGVIGLPVFAGFQSGIGVLLGPTGGYLIGFLLMAVIAMVSGTTTCRRVVAMVLGTLVCYGFGTIWYTALYTEWTLSGFQSAMLICVVPFVVPDALKLMSAVIVCRRLEPRLTDIQH